MPASRLPAPRPSYLREETVLLHSTPADAGRPVRLGMTAPGTTEDGWWVALLWAADDEGVLDTREIAPLAGPPPGPPLMTLGPLFTGALSGLVSQENERQALRLRLPPAVDENRPWERPLILQMAVKWEPLRAATMTPNQLAREALRAFGRAIVSTARPR